MSCLQSGRDNAWRKGGGGGRGGGGGGGGGRKVYNEEIEEEDIDYNVTYFDNGEDYGGDEDDVLEEGPCY